MPAMCRRAQSMWHELLLVRRELQTAIVDEAVSGDDEDAEECVEESHDFTWMRGPIAGSWRQPSVSNGGGFIRTLSLPRAHLREPRLRPPAALECSTPEVEQHASDAQQDEPHPEIPPTQQPFF